MTDMKRRQNIIRTIMDSYEKMGVINGIDGYLVPSRCHIEHVLVTLKELLFPGFFGFSDLETNDLASVTGKRVVQAIEELGEEIYKSMLWNSRTNLKDDISVIRLKDSAFEYAIEFMEQVPLLREQLRKDAEGMFEGDPAAKSITEVIVSYPGFQAIMVFRIAHYLFKKNIPLIPRIMSEIVHSDTGIDIHPGATIGAYFCIDHGTGIVIGETAVIGDYVKIYQGVTLGAFSVSKGKDTEKKRHPNIGNHVVIYARSTILGGDTHIGDHSVIGGNVWLVESVPSYTKLYISPDSRDYIQKTDFKA